MIVMLCLGETCVGDNFAAINHESGQIAAVNLESTSDFKGAYEYDASGYAIAPKKGGGLWKDADGNPLPKLPRDKHGNPLPDPKAQGAHTRLGTKGGRNGAYNQAREFDANGKPVRDVDFTDHGRPQNHTNPHQHEFVPNSSGGTPQHGPAKPL